MINYVLTFLSSYVFIGLKATQQLQVVHAQYIRIIPTSMLMAVCEVFVVVNAAQQGWGWIVLPIGLGSGLGCLTAIYLHRRFK